MDLQAVRERYLQDDFPKRLGALAANLARISSFSKKPENLDVIKGLLRESEYFIEWGISDAPIDLQEELVELQVRLAVWCYRLNEGKMGPEALEKEFQRRSE